MSEIDLHGYHLSVALTLLEEKLNDCIVNQEVELKIIHGLGSGKLRQEVHWLLDEYQNCIESYYLSDFWGAVTTVKF